MAVRRLTIPLDERACTLALGPYRPGYSLRPESRVAIERGSRLGSTVREVTCIADDACDMLDYFRSAADALTATATPKRCSALGHGTTYRMPSGSRGLPAVAIEEEAPPGHDEADVVWLRLTARGPRIVWQATRVPTQTASARSSPREVKGGRFRASKRARTSAGSSA